MASDFTPNQVKRPGRGGGVEGGTTPFISEPPKQESSILQDMSDKIVVEDIRIEPVSTNIHEGEEMPDSNEQIQESQIEIYPKLEIENEPESVEEVVEEPSVDIVVSDPEIVNETMPIIISDPEVSSTTEFQETDIPADPEVIESALDRIMEKMSAVREASSRIDQENSIDQPSPKKKRKVISDQPEEYSNMLSKLWNGFFDLFEFKSHREKAFTKSFVSVAVIISLISMFHVQGLFALVNPFWLSWVIAFAIEIAVIVSLFSLKMLDRVSSWMIWTLIFILFFLQAIGNTFSAFIALDMSNGLISQLVDMINILNVSKESIWLKRTIAFMVGGVLPLLAFLFIKSISEYLDNSDEEELYEEE